MADIPKIVIRRGRREDEPYIREFTKNTFEWGDYVGDAFIEWLDVGNDVYVAEVDGIPSAVTCVAYPADGEAWFQGIRVRPECRRLGIARRLTEASLAGAKERGARVCRAHIDNDNAKSPGLARSFGFRRICDIRQFELSLLDGSDGCRPALSGSLSVTRTSPEKAGELLNAASKDIRYLGSDFVWISLSQDNLRRIAEETSLLAVRDQDGHVVGGAILGEMYQADAEQGASEDEPPRLDCGLGSLFGSQEGLEALIKHASGLAVSEASKRGLNPGKLYINVEETSPTAAKVEGLEKAEPTFGGGIWELPLER